MPDMPREVAQRMREFFDAEAKYVAALEERNQARRKANLAIRVAPAMPPGLYVIDMWFFSLVREKDDATHLRCELGETGRVWSIE